MNDDEMNSQFLSQTLVIGSITSPALNLFPCANGFQEEYFTAVSQKGATEYSKISINPSTYSPLSW